MKISVIGTGYVGLVSGTCFSDMGNDVICVDINEDKIKGLKNGVIPFYEPGLEQIVIKNQNSGALSFTTDIKYALKNSDICFIAVGTPMCEDGSADLKYVIEVAKKIGENIDQYMLVVGKSTVPVGTAEIVKKTIQTSLSNRHSLLAFDVISNPEFLKEGAAINDFMKPDRIIVGADSIESFEIMRELYAPFTRSHDRFITMDIKSAEMTKYAANAMLATKISYMNEIANICELVGADVNMVRNGIGSDSRIGYSFIYPGCGYGGSCFPKDVQALVKTSQKFDYEAKLLNAVEIVNYKQKKILSNKVIKRFGEDLSTFTFAIWGLSFKPETDDMRDASSLTVINELTLKGAKIKAYDPKAMYEAKTFYLKNNDNVEYFDNKYDTLNDSNAMILLTEWKEFRSPDFVELSKRLKNNIIFDGRNQYNKEKLVKLNFEYFQIGVKND
mgnify:CR=1 FL=1